MGGGYKSLIKGKFQRIIVPYLLYAFILGVKPNSLDVVFRIFYGSIQSTATVTASHLWFLPCFFISVLMYGVIERANIKSKYNLRLIFVPVLIVLSFLTSKDRYGEILPAGWFWGLNSAFTGCVLMYVGVVLRYCIKHFFLYVDNKWLKLLLSMGLVAFGVIITIPNLHNNVNIAYASYGIYPLFYGTVFVMSAAVLLLAIVIDNSFSSIYGKYTLPIYAFHLLIMGVVNILLQKFGLTIYNVILQGCIVSVLTLFATTLVVKPIQKYAPNLVGEFK